MITLELLRVIRDGQPCEAELAARVRADGSEISIEGPEPELVDGNQPVLNLRDGTHDHVCGERRRVGSRARCVVPGAVPVGSGCRGHEPTSRR